MYFPKVNLDVKLKAYIDGSITTVNLKDYLGKNIILLFYPNDFTFVCPTELNVVSDRKEEFIKRNVVVFTISKDSAYNHQAWAKLPRQDGGVEGIQWPMLADKNARLSRQFGLYDDEEDITKRATVMIDVSGNVFNISIYHEKIGRNVDEILRLLDAMDHVSKHGDICPMDWSNKEKK